MNTYDDLVNDYLRAVEQALHGVPAGRRDELLADLSDHIAAKLAEARRAERGPAAHGSETEVRSVLDLLGDPRDLAAELEAAELEAAELEAAELEAARLDAAGVEAAGLQSAGPPTTDRRTAGPPTAGPRTAGPRTTGHAAAESPAPIEINPGRKLGALIWVLITIAMVSLLCVGVVLTAVYVFFTSR